MDFRDGQTWLLTGSSTNVSGIQDAMMNLYHQKTDSIYYVYILFKDRHVLLILVPHSLSILSLLSELNLLESKEEEMVDGRKIN